MFDDVDWTHRADYMRARHGISVIMANEALMDPNRLVIDPDPASRSGKGTRVIGWSQTAGHVVTVIVVTEDGVEYGANGWRTEDRDLRLYGDQE
ncbi:hypothetical protein [Microlunatus sp. GCM10028923]|uniref:hypothetical protein n=1 Tax=Microlunatus sp. GCM10028923 TaxID=3273400 RepID=UPI00361F5F56